MCHFGISLPPLADFKFHLLDFFHKWFCHKFLQLVIGQLKQLLDFIDSAVELFKSLVDLFLLVSEFACTLI